MNEIDDLLQDKAKAKALGENGLKLVSERYDFPAYIADLESMFERTQVACLSRGEIGSVADTQNSALESQATGPQLRGVTV